jgi:hypothetical protein
MTRAARHPTSATGAWSTFHHFQFPFTCRLTPGRQLLSARLLHQPRSFSDAAQNTSVLQADSERTRVSCVSAGVTLIEMGIPNVSTRRCGFAAFDPLMGIKAADSCRFLNGFHADVASTTAALGSGCLPRRSRQGSVQCTPQERPDPGDRASAGSGKKPSATVESRLASSATGTPFAGRRRSHRKWHARSGLATCLVWAEEGDGVADTPTPHPKDCWDNSYSSFQFITSLLSLIPKHGLKDEPTASGSLKFQAP